MASDGWCRPVLPDNRCNKDAIEVIGHAKCQPVADCGQGTYDKIKITTKTLFVNQSFTGASSDGSMSKPFKTIGEALKISLSTSKTHIALAAGKYQENVLLDNTNVELEGRCPQMVIISGDKKSTATLLIRDSTVKLTGVAITGPGYGVYQINSTLGMERVVVRDCQVAGMISTSGSILTTLDSLFDTNRGFGLAMHGTKATITRTVFRDNLPDKTGGRNGFGIQVGVDSNDLKSSSAKIVDSVFLRNRSAGIAVTSSELTMEGTVARGTMLPNPTSLFANGILVVPVRNSKLELNYGSNVTIRDSAVTHNDTDGILVDASDVTIEKSIISDNRQSNDKHNAGMGIFVWYNTRIEKGSTLTLKESAVVRNMLAGLKIVGSKAVIDGSVIADNKASKDLRFGYGIESSSSDDKKVHSTIVIRHSRISNNKTAGVILLEKVDVTFDNVYIGDTEPQPLNMLFGIGLQIGSGGYKSSAKIRNSIIENNHGFGAAFVNTTGFVDGCYINKTRGYKKSGFFGDGVLLQNARIDLIDSLVENSNRTGTALWDSGGTIKRNLFRNGRLSINLEGKSNPKIENSNIFEGNGRNSVSFGQGLQMPGIPVPP